MKSIKEGRSIIMDGANSHVDTIEMYIRRARESGKNYHIKLVRVQTTVETALHRAHARFAQSGRVVPEDDIIDKSELTRSVFARLAPLVDGHVTLANDNSLSIKYIYDNNRLTNKAKPIDVVVDLDWTLVYELTDGKPAANDPDVFQFKGKYFRYSKYAREFLLALYSDTRFRVSFYSGGDRDRVEYTLKNLVLEKGLTAFDAAFQVLNFKSLDEVDKAAKGFADRYKKNLRKVIESIDIQRAVLVDDIAHFLLRGQERAMLWLGKTYKYFATVKDVEAARSKDPSDQYIPPEKNGDKGKESHFLELHKLPYALGVIFEAADLHQKTGRTFAEAMQSLIKDENGQFINREAQSQRRFYKRGWSVITGVRKTFPSSANLIHSAVPLGNSKIPVSSAESANSGVCIDLF